MFFLPGDCLQLGADPVLPAVGTRVRYLMGTSAKTGKPCAVHIRHEENGDDYDHNHWNLGETPSADKAVLIKKVKIYQGTVKGGSQAWGSHCIKAGRKKFDPSLHESAFLRDFLISVAAIQAGCREPPPPAARRLLATP